MIDISADLHMEGNAGRNLARLPPGRYFAPGEVAVAGHPDGWSWVLIEEVDAQVLTFHQVQQ